MNNINFLHMMTKKEVTAWKRKEKEKAKQLATKEIGLWKAIFAGKKGWKRAESNAQELANIQHNLEYIRDSEKIAKEAGNLRINALRHILAADKFRIIDEKKSQNTWRKAKLMLEKHYKIVLLKEINNINTK